MTSPVRDYQSHRNLRDKRVLQVTRSLTCSRSLTEPDQPVWSYVTTAFRVFPRVMASFCRRWRLWILPVLTCLYALIIVILVPILLVNSIKNGFKKQDQGALVGGAFVLLALPIAFYEIVQHMIYYTQPRLQKYIIRWAISFIK